MCGFWPYCSSHGLLIYLYLFSMPMPSRTSAAFPYELQLLERWAIRRLDRLDRSPIFDVRAQASADQLSVIKRRVSAEQCNRWIRWTEAIVQRQPLNVC